MQFQDTYADCYENYNHYLHQPSSTIYHISTSNTTSLKLAHSAMTAEKCKLQICDRYIRRKKNRQGNILWHARLTLPQYNRSHIGQYFSIFSSLSVCQPVSRRGPEPRRFFGDLALLARDNIFLHQGLIFDCIGCLETKQANCVQN